MSARCPQCDSEVRRKPMHGDACPECAYPEFKWPGYDYCRDCGEPGQATGHMTRQYPQDRP